MTYYDENDDFWGDLNGVNTTSFAIAAADGGTVVRILPFSISPTGGLIFGASGLTITGPVRLTLYYLANDDTANGTTGFEVLVDAAVVEHVDEMIAEPAERRSVTVDIPEGEHILDVDVQRISGETNRFYFDGGDVGPIPEPPPDDAPVVSHRRRRRRRGVVTKLGKFRRPKGLKRSRGYPI